jgi:hypothetical protein
MILFSGDSSVLHNIQIKTYFLLMTKTTLWKMLKLMFQVILLLRNQKDIFHVNLQNDRLHVVTMSILIAVSLVEFRLSLSKYQATGLLHNLLYILYFKYSSIIKLVFSNVPISFSVVQLCCVCVKLKRCT